MNRKIRIKFRNKEFEKTINTNEKVSDLLSYLFVRLHFKEKNMTLKYGQLYLLNDKTFQSIGIKENDLIEVILKEYPITLSFKEKVEDVYVNDEMTVKDLKLKIAKQFEKDYDAINLEFDGNFLVKENVTLGSLGLDENCTITFAPPRELKDWAVTYVSIDPTRIKGKEYNINMVYKDQSVKMKSDDRMPVYELCLMVANRFNIPFNTVNLKFKDKYLVNAFVLMKTHNIYEDCTIHNEDYTVLIKNIMENGGKGKIFSIKTRYNYATFQLKEDISEKTGINSEFYLTYEVERLEDEKQLHTYNIPHNGQIQMICDLKGGFY